MKKPQRVWVFQKRIYSKGETFICVPRLFGSSSRTPVANPQCRIDRTMFFPTPRVTMASSCANTRGSAQTASTAFLSQVYRKTKVSWPENEDLGPGPLTAIQAGTDFLFELGKPGQIAEECKRAKIGKKLPDALYVHKSAEAQLSPLLQLMVLTARQIVGEIAYDLIKIGTDGKKLSFLAYKDFDSDPHPELAYSLKLYLPKATYAIRSYTDSLNPPILHRKETFVDQLHPRYAEYALLTKQEEEFNLLSRTDIGTRHGWQTMLASRSLRIENNRVLIAAS